MTAFDAVANLFKSSSFTLPAQNIPRSANYCVAKSPIGNLLNTMLHPKLAMLSNFSYIIFHSASTIDCYLLGSLMRTSALSFSAFNSNSTLRHRMVGLLKFLGCCSNPA